MILPRWERERVAILASGPSLRSAPLAALERSDCRVIAVNNSWTRAPWADALYACDWSWWRRYHRDVERGFRGRRFTQDQVAAESYGLEHIPSVDQPGLSRERGVIHQGGNSGYQAIGLAAQTGTRQILLFGFDMKGEHWHMPHEESVAGHLTKRLDFENWLPRFDALAAGLAEAGVDVINCTPDSALTCFRADTFQG